MGTQDLGRESRLFRSDFTEVVYLANEAICKYHMGKPGPFCIILTRGDVFESCLFFEIHDGEFDYCSISVKDSNPTFGPARSTTNTSSASWERLSPGTSGPGIVAGIVRFKGKVEPGHQWAGSDPRFGASRLSWRLYLDLTIIGAVKVQLGTGVCPMQELGLRKSFRGF